MCVTAITQSWQYLFVGFHMAFWAVIGAVVQQSFTFHKSANNVWFNIHGVIITSEYKTNG